MIDVIIAALAGWRIASLLVTEDGPWRIFERLRARFQFTEFSEQDGVIYEHTIPTNVVGEALSCVWCCSVWTSAAMFILYEFAPWPVMLIAAMGGALIVERVARREAA